MNQQHIRQQFGAQIRALRTARQLTQQNLADILGRHQTTIAKLENGSRPTTVKELYLLAFALNTSVTDLLPESIGA